jgi:hypothetical protein
LFLIIYLSLSLEKESGRSKTREELLAEERDYKRRRMSYRGKKMKRNPTEVHFVSNLQIIPSILIMLNI